MRAHSEPIEIVVHGRHSGVSEKFKEFVNDKLSQIARFAIPIHRIDVEVSHESNPRQHDRAFEVEITCTGSPFVRVEAHAVDKFSALDLAYEKLEERLRRIHERSKSVRHDRIHAGDEPTQVTIADRYEPAADASVVFESGPLVVRTKDIDTRPMSVEEAVEEMEMVGHDFYLFENTATGLPSVIYRRRGYDFGLVQLGSTGH